MTFDEWWEEYSKGIIGSDNISIKFLKTAVKQACKDTWTAATVATVETINLKEEYYEVYDDDWS